MSISLKGDLAGWKGFIGPAVLNLDKPRTPPGAISGYGDMVADQGRVEAYWQALRQTVKSGSVVLDIGTGPGLMAMLACQ